jgi:glycosyltransferase involved in cell wall biosynthesis
MSLLETELSAADRASPSSSFRQGQRRRVVIVSTQAGFRGGEVQASLLAEGLRQRGHECLIYARAGGPFAQQMAAGGFAAFTFPGRGRSPANIWRIRRQLRRHRPNVVHFNDSHALTGAGLAALGLGIVARVVARRVDFPIHSPWRYRHLADRTIAVSHCVAAVCRAANIGDEQIRVIHDGVDPCRASSGDRSRGRQSLSLTDERPLVVTVAALTDDKGHAFLLRAVPRVLARHPRACFALAGDGALRAKLETEARTLGIDSAVRFLGYRRDIPDLLRAADLFVMPSQREGLCSTLIEAMLARVPIVAATTGGIPEVVGPLSGGEGAVAQLVPPGDPAALAAAINAVLADPARSRETVQRAESRARDQFTAERMVEETLAVYEELLAR